MFGRIGEGRRFGVAGRRRRGGVIWLRPRTRGIRGSISDLLISLSVVFNHQIEEIRRYMLQKNYIYFLISKQKNPASVGPSHNFYFPFTLLVTKLKRNGQY